MVELSTILNTKLRGRINTIVFFRFRYIDVRASLFPLVYLTFIFAKNVQRTLDFSLVTHKNKRDRHLVT